MRACRTRNWIATFLFAGAGAFANDRVQGQAHATSNAFLQAVMVYKHLPLRLFDQDDFFRDARTGAQDALEEKYQAERGKKLSEFRWNAGYGIAWNRTDAGMRGNTPLPEMNDVTHLFRAGFGIESAFPWDISIQLGMDSIPAREYGGGMAEIALGYAFSLRDILDEEVKESRFGAQKRTRKPTMLRDPSLNLSLLLGVTKDAKAPVAADLGTDATKQAQGLDIYGQHTGIEAFLSGSPLFAARLLFDWHRYGGGDPDRFLNYMRDSRAQYTGLEGPVPIYRGFPRYELQGTLLFYFDQVWEFDLGGGLMRPWFDPLPYQYYVNPKLLRLFGDRWLIGLGGDFRIEDTHPYLMHPSAVLSLHVSYFF